MQPVGLCDRCALVPAGLGSARDEVHCPGVDGDEPRARGAARRSARAPAGTALRCGSRSTSGSRSPPAWRAARPTPARRCGSRRAPAARALRDESVLREIAAEIGADVPAQVRPRRYLATGAGELLHALPDAPPFGLLIAPLERSGCRPRTCSARPTASACRAAPRARGAARRARRGARRGRADAARRAARQRPRARALLAAARARRHARGGAPQRRRPRDGLRVRADGRRAVRGPRAGARSGRRARRAPPAPIAVEPWYESLSPLEEA